MFVVEAIILIIAAATTECAAIPFIRVTTAGDDVEVCLSSGTFLRRAVEMENPERSFNHLLLCEKNGKRHLVPTGYRSVSSVSRESGRSQNEKGITSNGNKTCATITSPESSEKSQGRFVDSVLTI